MRAYFVAAILIAEVNPCLASEAFVPQVLSKKIAGGEVTVNGIDGGFHAASAIATPVSLSAARSSESSPSNPMNVSYIAQQGTNNLVAVSQTGGRNLSAIMQSGVGNQAIVTQRR